MIKTFTFLLLSVLLNANLINKISIVVNDEPITSHDITTLKNEMSNNISQEEAKEILINRAIENILIKEYSIKVNQTEIDKEVLEKRDTTQNIIRKLSLKKLYKKIIYSNTKEPSQSDLKTYYENNKHRFKMTNTMDTIRYASRSRDELVKMLNNPMSNNSLIDIKNMSVKLSNLNPQLASLLENTEEKTFTPIISFGSTFVTIYISKKYGQSSANFESIKERLSMFYLKDKEKSTVVEFINKKRRKATIKYF